AVGEGIVRFFSHSQKPAGLMMELFKKTFGLELIPESPYTAAARIGLDKEQEKACNDLEMTYLGVETKPLMDEAAEEEECARRRPTWLTGSSFAAASAASSCSGSGWRRSSSRGRSPRRSTGSSGSGSRAASSSTRAPSRRSSRAARPGTIARRRKRSFAG